MALKINPNLKIVAWVLRVRDAELFQAISEVELVSPEYEASREFLRKILTVSGLRKDEIKKVLPIVEKEQKLAEFSQDEEV